MDSNTDATKMDALRITKELCSNLKTIYSDRLKAVYLYGSYARGESTNDSDIDIAVVLAGELNRYLEMRSVSELLSNICLKENCLISLLFISQDEWSEKPYAIHRNIARDGIAA